MYEIRWVEPGPPSGPDVGWYAWNPSQGLNLRFLPGGVRVTPAGETRSWVWGIEVIGFGRDAVTTLPAAAILAPLGNSIAYDRGPVVEHYLNRSTGLKQEFVIAEPPLCGVVDANKTAPTRIRRDPDRADCSARPAWVALRIDTDLRPRLINDGRAIEFTDLGSGITALHYAGLTVQDAGGRVLPAWMELTSDARSPQIRLVFDDREARYPVTIDPLVTVAAWTGTLDQWPSRYAYSVAMAGDVDGDGYSDVIAGAPDYWTVPGPSTNSQGAAAFYHGSASGVETDFRWIHTGDLPWSGLGRFVSTAGDVNGDGYDEVIFTENGPDIEHVRAHVLHGSTVGCTGVDWSYDLGIIQFAASADAVGPVVSGAGDVNGDGFGDVIAGAPSDGLGRAYLFFGSESGLSDSPDWEVEAGQNGTRFGAAVSPAGDVNDDGYDDVVVGEFDFNNGDANVGRVFVYWGSETGPSQTPDWTVDGGSLGVNRLGYAVDAAGDVNGDGYDDVVIGTWFSGKAFVFHGSSSGLSVTPDWTGEVAGSTRFGAAVSSAGDLNGDGFSDVIVGAPGWSGAGPGKVYAYLGSGTGLSASPMSELRCNDPQGLFGFSVDGAGDVNGDGFADVIVGAPDYVVTSGAAFVFHGSPASTPGPAGAVPNGLHGGTPLTVAKEEDGGIRLAWGPSCQSTDLDFEIYTNPIGDFNDHEILFCSTSGETHVVFEPVEHDAYYLVVPRSADHEGSYGRDGEDNERPASTSACLDQAVFDCY